MLKKNTLKPLCTVGGELHVNCTAVLSQSWYRKIRKLQSLFYDFTKDTSGKVVGSRKDLTL